MDYFCHFLKFLPIKLYLLNTSFLQKQLDVIQRKSLPIKTRPLTNSLIFDESIPSCMHIIFLQIDTLPFLKRFLLFTETTPGVYICLYQLKLLPFGGSSILQPKKTQYATEVSTNQHAAWIYFWQCSNLYQLKIYHVETLHFLENIGSGNGLLLDGTKPPPEPMLTYCHYGPVTFKWG